MPKTITLYACEICDQRFDKLADAIKCERRGRPGLIAAVGDIVTARSGFGWYNGDRRWIANFDRIGEKTDEFAKPAGNESHGNCFGDCCTYSFYYVVTVIDVDPQDRHSNRYHLWTKAMTGTEGYSNGWTFDRGSHYTPEVVEDRSTIPAIVRREAKELIGRKAESLL